MKTNVSIVLVVCAAIVLTFVGCGKETDASSELEKAASMIAQEGATQTSPQPSQTSGPVQARAAASRVGMSPATPAQQMKQAVASYKSGDLQDAVAKLQELRNQAAMSPQQLMALQDAMAAVMSDVYARAAKGDPRARQAVKRYEAMQNARRN